MTPSRPLVARFWAALRPGLGRIRRGVRRAIDRALHQARRRSAVVRLTTSKPWERALVLCHGNICRSPYAASVLTETLVARGIVMPVHQGGFVGPGRRSPVTARAVARANGIELRAHRSRLVTVADTRGQTLVVVMETGQAQRVMRELGVPWSRIVVLGDLDPAAIDTRDITDPWRLGPEVFEEVYSRISRCVVALAECLESRSVTGASGRTEEVVDSGRLEAPGDEALHIRIMHG